MVRDPFGYDLNNREDREMLAWTSLETGWFMGAYKIGTGLIIQGKNPKGDGFYMAAQTPCRSAQYSDAAGYFRSYLKGYIDPTKAMEIELKRLYYKQGNPLERLPQSGQVFAFSKFINTEDQERKVWYGKSIGDLVFLHRENDELIHLHRSTTGTEGPYEVNSFNTTYLLGDIDSGFSVNCRYNLSDHSLIVDSIGVKTDTSRLTVDLENTSDLTTIDGVCFAVFVRSEMGGCGFGGYKLSAGGSMSKFLQFDEMQSGFDDLGAAIYPEIGLLVLESKWEESICGLDLFTVLLI